MAVYLINRMPTTHLKNKCPHEILFGSTPNYLNLRIFGCLCYPWLRPYSQNKLSNRSMPCVFFGYSTQHCAYQCYHPPTQKLYLSRHVTFHESLFPFLLNLYASSTSSILNSNSNTNKHFPSRHPLIIQHLNHPIIPPPSPQNSNSSLIPTPLISPTTHTPTISPPIFQVPTNSSARSLTGTASSTQHPSPESTRIVTRSVNQIHKPNPKYLLTTKHPLASSIEPTCVSQALKSSEWRNAMSDEFDALIQQGTWELVPQPQAANLIGCKWVYRIKENPTVILIGTGLDSWPKAFIKDRD